MLTRTHIAIVTAASTALITVAGCSVTADKAGGAKAQHPLVLQVINTRSADEVQPFVDKLAELSHGALRLDFNEKWHRGSSTVEADAIRAIEAGEADLGIDAARAWDEVGVSSFDALLAPLAVDSQALQEKVLAGDIPAQMLAGLTPLGLTGIGILPGVMRRPVGITRALLSPADYRGATIGIGASVIVERAMRALGARTVPSGFEGADISAFDGIEQQASSVGGSEYDGVASTITENVHLWPRPLVIFGSARSTKRLSEQQLGWLRSAAQDSDHDSAVRQANESEEISNMCRRGRVTFVEATPTQLAQLRAAFQPVYAWLESNTQTRRFLDQIAALRASGVPPYPRESLTCAGVPKTASTAPGSAAVTPFDGTYRSVTTASDGPDPNPLPENWGTWIFVFTRGRFAFTQENATACTWGYGTYVVTGQQIEWLFIDGGGIAPTGAYNKAGEDFFYRWSRYRNTMTLAAVPGKLSPGNFVFRHWHELSSKADPSYLNPRCPPPATALTG